MLEYVQYPYALLALIVLVLLLWRPAYGVAMMAAIFPLDPWSPRAPVPGLNTETALVGVALAVTILRFGARVPPLRYSGPVIAFIGVMFVAFALALPWARNMETVEGTTASWAVFKIWKSITFTSLLFFPVYWWSRTAEDRDRMLRALCIGLFISAVAGVVDYFHHINPQSLITDRAGGLVVDPNAMAETIGAMMFIPLYIVFQSDHGRRWKGFAALTYAISGLAMVLSLSRGNWVAMLAAHGVYLLMVNRTLLLGGVATVLVVATIGFPLLPQVVQDRILMTRKVDTVVYGVGASMNLESSTAARVVLARIGLDMFERSPIWGNGLHSFNIRTPEFGAKYGILVPKDAHNIVVKLAADAGLIGLAVLAYLIGAVILTGRRLWRSSSPEHVLGAVLLAGATHVLVANLSATSFLYAKQSSAQFWMLFAIASRAYVERATVPAGATAVAAAFVPRWRRFAHRTPAALSQP
jgi:O-antigen ligase